MKFIDALITSGIIHIGIAGFALYLLKGCNDTLTRDKAYEKKYLSGIVTGESISNLGYAITVKTDSEIYTMGIKEDDERYRKVSIIALENRISIGDSVSFPTDCSYFGEIFQRFTKGGFGEVYADEIKLYSPKDK